MILFLLMALSAAPPCHPIQSDWIQGRDLAAAVPAFATLAPDLRIALSPVPGQPRVFHISDLRRIAAANHITADISGDACFAWPVRVLPPESIVAAMKVALGSRVSTIEFVEQSLMPAPEGPIIFPLQGLGSASDGPVLWRGYVEYADHRRFPVWARVRLSVEQQRVIATSDLTPNQAIRKDQIEAKSVAGPLTNRAFLADPEKAVGAVPRRSIAAGTPITDDMIDRPLDVQRGDWVNVIVQNGAARLEAQGIAQQSGRCGDIISVKNPKSARAFRARVTKTGMVTVVPGGPVEIVTEQSSL
ncbi:MAG: flagellar basal body P-ring formation protein FlgA [Acidobacteriaceae bacterium]|nr:flagellar basal body P-ring formation protein FlgA [Acidobacteriaceae bacterium]MBV8571483.1 flagellar basal body P-ring formation protein FlgA [Acidobacteriaceae bacterium]